MGFWNALSALAPIAPAMAEAKDIRTARDQDQQQFAQDQQLKQAQLTAQQFAAQAEQQRIIKQSTVRDLGWNQTAQSDQVLIQDPKDGTFRAQNVPGGVSPADRYKNTVDEFKQVVKRDPTPEENNRFLMQSYGMAGSPTAGMGSPKPVTLKGPGGEPIGAAFINGKYYGEDGKEIESPEIWQKPAPVAKPASPSAQYANLLAKQILANKKQGPPLTNEEMAQLQASQSALTVAGVARAQAFAQAAAANNMIAITDPNTGMDTLVTRQQAVNMADSDNAPLAGAVSAPTGMDKKNQLLAQSALMQIDSMERVLAADPTLTGPGSGQLTKLQNWIGSGSEDAGQFLAAATFLSEHGVGVFGGRNIHSIQDLQGLMGDLKKNPAQLKASLEQARTTMQPWATAGGRLPGPKMAGGGGDSGKGLFTVTDPNNKVHRFDTQAQAIAFKRLAGIQ
jgi:hypothetical protein